MTSTEMILSLFTRSWYSSAKTVSQHHCRAYSWSFVYRKCPSNSRCHQYLPSKITSTKFNQGIYRTFLTHEHVPTDRSNHIARKDGIPSTYELIYSISMANYIKFGHWAVISLACFGVFGAVKFYLIPRDGSPDSVKFGAFDDDQMKGVDEDEVKFLMKTFFVVLAGFYFIVTKIPLRIYRSNTASERHYIATYVSQLMPWTVSNHQFPSASKVKFNFITRYFFYLETYKLGRKRAFIFPASFRTAYDHDEMIDFQLGKAIFDVKKEIEDYETYQAESRRKVKTKH